MGARSATPGISTWVSMQGVALNDSLLVPSFGAALRCRHRYPKMIYVASENGIKLEGCSSLLDYRAAMQMEAGGKRYGHAALKIGPKPH